MRARSNVRVAAGVALTAGVAVLGGCAGAGDSGQPATTVAVTATDSACTLSDPTVPVGSVTVDVSNQGQTVTEVYVYGDGDSIVGEKEDITPGSSAQFDVSLKAGGYTVTCKPGQTGDGISSTLTAK
ncbi:MAG: cupredoxin domain-containing protein [Actinomycetes bacterium]